MFRLTRLRCAQLLIFLSSLSILQAQEQDLAKEVKKPSSPELLVIPVGEPPIRKLRTVKDSDGNDRLENVAPPKQWTPPDKVVISGSNDASTEVYLQQNTLSRPAAIKAAAFSILVDGGAPLATTRDAASFPEGVQSKLELCVMRAAITAGGPDWTKPKGITFNSDWSVFTVGSFRAINMSSYPAIFQTAKAKVLIPPDQCRQFKEPIPNGTPFAVLINTPNGVQRVRQTAFDLPEGTRKTMVIFDKAFDKRQTLADITQFLETP